MALRLSRWAALLTPPVQLASQRLNAHMEPAAYRAVRRIQDLADLGEGESIEKTQQDDFPLRVGQGLQRAADVHLHLPRLDFLMGIFARRAGARGNGIDGPVVLSGVIQGR